MNKVTDVNELFEFYLITTPAFEDLCADELKSYCPVISLKAERGGVAVNLPLATGLMLNRHLKTPNRILLRLSDFGCRDFPKLFKKISGFPWDQWISDDTEIEFQASSRASRLKMKKRIEETCLDGRKKFLQKKNSSATGRSVKAGKTLSSRLARVFVRLQDDVCTLSLDTSGELLFRRGLRPLVSEAPLRETIAASLLLWMEKHSDSEKVGERRAIQVLDPMMGGGTFLIEALGLHHEVRSRDFAFESYEPLITRALGALTPKTSAAEFPSLSSNQSGRIRSVIGFESDESVLGAAKENLTSFISSYMAESEMDVRLIGADFFKAEKATLGIAASERRDYEKWLVCNPPYGERIKIEGRLTDYYSRLLLQSEKVFEPDWACFIFPDKFQLSRLKIPSKWRLSQSRKFQNGGLSVIAALYRRSVPSMDVRSDG